MATTTFTGSKYSNEEEEDDDDEEEELDSCSTTSFSLQECINEFRARRIRRVSTHSRECDNNNMPAHQAVPDQQPDADLINQNRCNKAQERKVKPCQNGFCYCFTSDSGDCASTRGQHVRQHKRSRRSDLTKSASKHLNQNNLASQQQQKQATRRRRQSEPPINVKPLTAVSRLCTVGEDAPLIHIIQELRDNCVVSEVRVNRQKLSKSPPKAKSKMPTKASIAYQPTAPALSHISEQEESSKTLWEVEEPTQARRSTGSRRSSSGAGGRLLKKRLSEGKLNFKTRDVQQPPPKPPRRSTQSLDSMTSTTPSVKEAERVLDEFLASHGVKLPNSEPKKNKRRSYPVAERDKPKPTSMLPTCPSLSDLERVVESKRGSHYAKNIQQKAMGKHPVEKEVLMGWSEPKIKDMLNYADKPSQFSSAEPQVTIGWQLPKSPQPVVPKISLDTVDGSVCENLASNMEQKHTPLKYPRVNVNPSQKFIWGEQFRNMSPWQSHKKTTLSKKSKNFLNQSKNKILRFVSPKKSNQQSNESPQISSPRLCSVGVQTQMDLPTQSPPGSYHSPVQLPPHKEEEQEAPMPPKKLQRARKLDFQTENMRTYRSYHKDLDQDVTITKMGYLLSSIRSKLEASDQRAARTFQDCSRLTPLQHQHHQSQSFDCLDGPSNLTTTSASEEPMRPHHLILDSEPIYSEIEEDCLRIRGSPQYEVRTAAQLMTPTPSHTTATVTSVSTPFSATTPSPAPTAAAADLNAPIPIYAQVQKKTNKVQPVALGEFLQKSLKNGSFFQFMPLPDEPSLSLEESTSSSGTSVIQKSSPLMHQSLNNISEQHSPPKRIRNLSKSELSLQRSEIFLDNLCRSEIVLDQEARLEKVPNASADVVSYDLPHEAHNQGLYDEYSIEDASSSFSTHQGYGSTQLEPPPPPSENQSTPKKPPNPRFTTKPRRSLSIDLNEGGPANTIPERPLSHSCPSTPQQPTQSLGDLLQALPSPMGSQLLSVSAVARYRLLKDALRRSYRKGKSFLTTLNLSRDQSHQTEGELDSSTSYYASFNLDSLMNASLSPQEQLAAAVNICRQMPELEISSEMVEAERLLLFSKLREQTQASSNQTETLASRCQLQSFLIDGMHLPVRADVSQDMFFNYHYICTFECNGRICSTQSVECENGSAWFRDCGLEFYSGGLEEGLELRCQIFMLRLRKVSTLALEPCPKGKSGSCSSNSSASDQIVSRFRLNASFSLKAHQLAPFDLVASETSHSNKMCLRSSNTWQLPLTPHTKSTNLQSQISLTGRVELRLPKPQYAGYLNVQDSKSQHLWNRRWCTLDGLLLSVWSSEHNLNSEPALCALELQQRKCKLDVAPRELCARARSFLLHAPETEVFFSADTQLELVEWLKHLNEALDFAKQWLRGGD